MPLIDETAYPRLKSHPSARDLETCFTPTPEESLWARSVTTNKTTLLALLTKLKTFQRLGRFEPIASIPPNIIEHIAGGLGYLFIPQALFTHDTGGSRHTHMSLIRAREDVRPFSVGGQAVVESAVRRTAQTGEDLRDMINAAIEDLVRHRIELPGFTTLETEAELGRTEVNRGLHRTVWQAITLEDRTRMECVLTDPGSEKNKTAWHDAKREAGPATLKHFRELVAHRRWLERYAPNIDLAQLLPDAKLRQFAAEAESLDASSMKRIEPDERRITLLAALLSMRTAQAKDNVGETLVKRMLAVQTAAQEALNAYRLEHQPRADRLIRTFHGVLDAFGSQGTDAQRLALMDKVIAGQLETLREDCIAHEAYANNNTAPFMGKPFANDRAVLFSALRAVQFRSSSTDASLELALAFIQQHQARRAEWVVYDPALDLRWVEAQWWALISPDGKRHATLERINRRQFEVCVFQRLMHDLKSGDAFIEGALEYADYRAQLVTPAEFEVLLPGFLEAAGLPDSFDGIIERVKAELEKSARLTDESFPANHALRIENGEPVLARIRREPSPAGLKRAKGLIQERLEAVTVLEAMSDGNHHLDWVQPFGPVSGREDKLEHPVQRYLATTFCYGCNLGPSQAARSLEGATRRGLSLVNARHITARDLDRATAFVVNGYNRFALPRHWGTGERVAADGTKWSVYENNLLSEYHIRYGGYGGIGYYHVSDTYIALFSHFFPCGTWEAVHIFDGFFAQESEIKPHMLHADTQGQNAPAFPLAFFFGAKLMPRIRDWKSLDFLRPSREAKYGHIDALFGEAVNWTMIRTHLPDMLRIAVSIRSGRVSASTILKRLSTYSRKNHVYQAFVEFGKALRTTFLLEYLRDAELRRTIGAALNKVEAFNKLVQWVAFGGQVIASNSRAEQQKFIKYNQLVANLLIYHNVWQFTRVLKALAREGTVISDEVLACLSPYWTEHINRFGEYRLNLERVPEPPEFEFRLEVIEGNAA
jgi:TnpA family transposase